jgi:hypothetical protein
MKFIPLRNLIHFLAEFTSRLKYFEVFKLTSFTHKNVQSSKFQVPGSWFKVPRSKFKVSSSRVKGQSSRFLVLSSKFQVPSSRWGVKWTLECVGAGMGAKTRAKI